MRNGVPARKGNRKSCCSAEDARDARRVADHLGIPFYAANFRQGFSSLIDHFVAEYSRGRTPNPCILCNQNLKFGRMFDYAAALGADLVATGHYAIIDRSGPIPVLRKGRDLKKDQSYMLFAIGRQNLPKIALPLGELTKFETRRIAREEGLPVADKEESQEICFVPEQDYRRLLLERDPSLARPGPIRDEQGRIVGAHPGHSFFTIGQRKGLGIAFGSRKYVTQIEPETNTITVGDEASLWGIGFFASDVRWLSIEPPLPGQTLCADVKIRHGHPPSPARIRILGPSEVSVEFHRPEKMITPGQGAAFYQGDILLGGGWISRRT